MLREPAHARLAEIWIEHVPALMIANCSLHVLPKDLIGLLRLNGLLVNVDPVVIGTLQSYIYTIGASSHKMEIIVRNVSWRITWRVAGTGGYKILEP